MSLVHVFCSMESYWRMLHSVYRLALFSGPQGPVSLCHWMPLAMYPWCSKIHLFDLPLWMKYLGCTFPPSFQVDAGFGLDSQDKFMNYVSFIQHIFMTKRIMSGIEMIHTRQIDWLQTIAYLKVISRLLIQETLWLFWFWKYVVGNWFAIWIWMFLIWTLQRFSNQWV